MQKVLRRFDYDLSAMKLAAGSIVMLLLEAKEHAEFYQSNIKLINERLSDVAVTDVEAIFWTLPELQSPSGASEQKSH